jgi:hypothetical protein
MKTTNSARLLLFLILTFFVSISVFPAYASSDSTSFDPRNIYVVAKPTGGGVPVGTVIAWPAHAAPEDAENWLDCDGRSTAGYPELAAIVGANVPDYRGMFLRGHGAQYHLQNNGSTIGDTWTMHQSGALGPVQGDGIRNIDGSVGHISSNSSPANAAGSFFWGFYSILQPMTMTSGQTRYYNIVFDASRVVPTADEIRPANMAVRYLIRARA